MILSIHKCFFAAFVSLAFAGVSFAQQPVDSVVASRGAQATLDEMIQHKLDSLNSANQSTAPKANTDSLAKAKADSVRKMIQAGKYVQRAKYDKSNFDHWKVDTLFQKKVKDQVNGVWRTPIVAHGHAFRDAELQFNMNDTLTGATRTYASADRYQKTGDYAYKARYRFDNDSSMVTREVFRDRQVIRWDYVTFTTAVVTLHHTPKSRQFRDLHGTWLNALQGFENVPPENYVRDQKETEKLKKQDQASAKSKK